MRITHNILISNFLRNLNNISNRIENSQLQLASGLKYNSPSDGPIEVGQVAGYRSTISKIGQYLKNVDDGISQVSYLDTILQSEIGNLGRTRDLILDGASDEMNQADRDAIAQEINLILQSSVSNANTRFRDRFMFAGWQTRTSPFDAVENSITGYIEDVIYKGNLGRINRLVGDYDELTVNVSGKDVYMDQTYSRVGKVLPVNTPLGFDGTLTINHVDFTISPDMTLTDIQLMLNAASDETNVFASIQDARLILESTTAVSDFTLADNKDNQLLDNLGLYVSGAFNLGFTPPTLPIIDSTPAIFTGAGPVANLTYDSTNNVMNIFLGADANNGVSRSANIYITQGSYTSVADLITEIQKQINLEFGTDRILVSDAGGGVLQLETVATGDEINAGDLVIGGPFNGIDDTASDSADLNLIAVVGNAPATPAGIAGTDGNDKFFIDLGPTTSKTGVDIPPQIIDLRASVITTMDNLVEEIKYQIFQNDPLRGTVDVSLHQGRLYFETVKTGTDVLAVDFQFTEGATGTLSALGISDTPFPIQVVGTPLYPPPGPPPPDFPFIVIPGFNDTVVIDLGPTVSNDGTNPDPVTLVMSNGTYNTIYEVETELNSLINGNPTLNGAVEVLIQGPPTDQYLVLQSTKLGPGLRGEDLVLGGSIISTLGWTAGAASEGGGSGDGRGVEIEPSNYFNTLINVRNDLLGIAGPETELLNAQNENRDLFGLIEGDIVTITYDAGITTFQIVATDTLRDFVQAIQETFGTRADVSLNSEGQIEIENLETHEIQNISITVESVNGEPRELFNEVLDDIPSTIPGLTKATTDSMFDPIRHLRLGEIDLLFADADLENLLRHEAIVGARGNRLNTLISQFTADDLNIKDLKTSIEAANYAEVITSLSQQELILQAALGVAANVLTPSLLDYLL